MTHLQRRIFKRGLLVGSLLTITVIAADLAGALVSPEAWLYDTRARHFQSATPRPTDALVHIDIDDQAVASIGRWPWPRSKVAAMLDELHLAGVKALATDILFADPQEPEAQTEIQDDDSLAIVRTIDGDAALAAAVRQLGCAVIPGSYKFDPSATSQTFQLLVDELRKEPSLDEQSLLSRVSSKISGGKDAEKIVRDGYLSARRVAMFERIQQEMTAAPLDQEALRQKLLPNLGRYVHSPASRDFDEQFRRWSSAEAIKKLVGNPASNSIHLDPIPLSIAPLPAIAQAAAATGFVDFRTARDGVLRSMPLLVNFDGHIVPQVGLSLAMLTLGARPQDLQISSSAVSFKCPDGRTISIPIYLDHGTPVCDIPWFGSQQWENMYDWPAHQKASQHLSLNVVWGTCETRNNIIKNNAAAADAMNFLAERLGVKLPSTAPATRPSDDPDQLSAEIDRISNEAASWRKMYQDKPPAADDRDGLLFVAKDRAIQAVRSQNRALGEQLQKERTELAKMVSGKSVLIGFVATGLTDTTSTSLHPKSPGVIAHGVMFNAIMTGDLWSRAPGWIAPLITLALGTIAALMASSLSPVLGLVAISALGGVYFLFNASILFDHNNLVLDLAGSLIVLFVVWGGCTLNRIIIESGERHRITRRFQSYVDPSLVSHLLENPDLVRLEGEERQLTVVFTDLKGFTAISEKLGEKTVQLLNEYFGLMVPLIRANNGTLNKFLGDGIMFFFGAPISSSQHATQAVTTVLAMQDALPAFNEELQRRGLPKVGMRAGVSSGMMVVGDAGSKDASDYTVLGDTVNLGARLESANKATGTLTLINGTCAELIRDAFLLRPIAKLIVVGKTERVMTYEPICRLAAATAEQREIAQLTAKLVDSFCQRRFDDCIAAAEQIDARLGPGNLTALYRQQCQQYKQTPPPDDFDGTISLTEK